MIDELLRALDEAHGVREARVELECRLFNPLGAGTSVKPAEDEELHR
jgi:hypothetical protein